MGIPLISVATLMLVAGVTFQALTPIEIPWKAALRGGAVTALIGLAAAFLVGIYLSTAGATGTLGALGGVAILLFFFNLMWVVYLFGAEVTKVYSDYLRYGDVMAPSERQGESPTPIVHQEVSQNPTRVFAIGAALGWLIGRRR